MIKLTLADGTEVTLDASGGFWSGGQFIAATAAVVGDHYARLPEANGVAIESIETIEPPS